MNLYEILIVSENKEIKKGYYTSYKILATDLENAKKIALIEANKDGYVVEIDETELILSNQKGEDEKIISEGGRAYFDC